MPTKSDDDVSAVVGLFFDQAVQFGCGGGHVSPGQVFVFGVDSLEGSLDVVSPEVALALFQSEPGEDAGGGYLVCAGVLFVRESEEAWGVLDPP